MALFDFSSPRPSAWCTRYEQWRPRGWCLPLCLASHVSLSVFIGGVHVCHAQPAVTLLTFSSSMLYLCLLERAPDIAHIPCLGGITVVSKRNMDMRTITRRVMLHGRSWETGSTKSLAALRPETPGEMRHPTPPTTVSAFAHLPIPQPQATKFGPLRRGLR